MTMRWRSFWILCVRRDDHNFSSFLGFGADIIMAALCNRAGHYIFALWFLSIFFYLSFFYSSPNLSGRRLDVYHTWCGPSANLECRSEGAARASLQMQDPKKSPKIAIPQLCRAISSQLRHASTIGKKTCEAAISPLHVLAIWWTSAH